MTTDQQFCLRWNNFHTNITSAFESLRDDEDFVDITLACEGRQIKAHKMVLSACSPYFRHLLRGNPCQHPIVFLKDVTFANLTSILDFMYHGEVNVSHNELATFLKTAEALRVRGLAEDEKKRDADACTESSSPPPPRDPPEPCSPGRPDEPPGEGGGRISVGPADNNSSNDGPPPKRQRRRSGGGSSSVTTASVSAATISPRPSSEKQLHSTPSNTSTDLTSQQLDSVRECVKNEPEDYVNEDDEMLGQQQQTATQQSSSSSQSQQIASEDIKLDGFSSSQDDSEYMGNESVSISRNQVAMQQLQDTFSSFIPGMSSQNPGGSFLPHSTASGEHSRTHPPPFSLEGVVQGLPPGISALPGPSMSQSGGASQDSSGQELLGITTIPDTPFQLQQHITTTHRHLQQQQTGHSSSSAASFSSSTMPMHQQQTDSEDLLDFQQYQIYNQTGGLLDPSGLSSLGGGSTSSSGGGGGVIGATAKSKGLHICPHCDKPLSSSHGLRRHIDDRHTVHVQTYICRYCNKGYKTPNSLQNHVYVYHKRKDCAQTVST